MRKVILLLPALVLFMPTIASAGSELDQKAQGEYLADIGQRVGTSECKTREWEKLVWVAVPREGVVPSHTESCHVPQPEPVAVEPAVPEEEAAVVAPESTYSGGVSNSTVMCESGGDYGANTGNGYYGGYQFDSGTWDAYGDDSYSEAHLAPPAVQDQAAASVPYDAWPNC